MIALVTGGAGLIGSHLVDLLLERGYEVRVYDNLDPTTHPHGLPVWCDPTATEFYTRDVRDLDGLEAASKGVDVVFHQAAFGGFSPDASKAMDVNVTGTARVLAAARHAGVRKVVVASSQAVYGNGAYECADPHGSCGWTTEEYGPALRSPDQLAAAHWELLCPRCGGPMRPLLALETDAVDLPSPYALSKFAAERLALMHGAQYDVPVVALRYALTFGPRQSVSNPYTGIASMFSTRLLAGQAPPIYEDGWQTRDFTYVGDVAAANLLVAEDDRANGEVFNVGRGTRTAVLDFAEALRYALLQRQAGTYSGPIEPCGRYRPADARHTAVDPANLTALGWEPKTTINAGLAAYVDWFIESGGGVVVDAEAELMAAGVVRSWAARPA